MNNRLWKNTFDNTRWQNQEKIDSLLQTIKSMNEIMQVYLDQVRIEFPQLTDHSIIHSEMLWKYADIIIGDKKGFLNPLEGFVLHAAFLLHDSGMCYSVLNSKDFIKTDPVYMDYISSNFKKLKDKELESEAFFYTVRQNHGDYAIRIAKEKLRNDDYFINETTQRDEFSNIIGKIAKSHSCNINYIEREFGSEGYSSPRYPSGWTIDCQKLAYILRVADAAHLDNLRTPKTKKLIAEIEGDSREHWTFQKKLGVPTIGDDNLLCYATNEPFNLTEQKAWWYCYASLRVLDSELKNAYNYFLLNNKTGFDAIGVKSIDDTLVLGRYFVKTDGWDSVDTTIKVTNPIHIASELGGVKLYQNPNLAIRELLQNSIDAINLYRVYTSQISTAVGKIRVESFSDNGKFFLRITDNGIGMSSNLMTTELLDFGGSYWRSNKFYNDFKGVVHKGFQSIGKFGIGFFSVFMLGKRVVVTSWKYGEDRNKIKTLDFFDGIFSNPILRPATQSEKEIIIDRGTSVLIELEFNPFENDGMLFRENLEEVSLYSLVKYYMPGIDVEIETTEVNGEINTLPPKTIENLNYTQMFKHLKVKKQSGYANGMLFDDIKKTLETLPLDLIDIKYDDGENIMGRLVLIPNIANAVFPSGAILSDGIRVKDFGGVVGYINTADVITIKRDVSVNIIPFDKIKDWAGKQIHQILDKNLVGLYGKKYNDLLIAFGFFDENFPLIYYKKDNNYYSLTIKAFKSHLQKNDEISFYQEAHSLAARKPDCPGFIKYEFGLNEFKEFILEKDKDKLLSSSELIKIILKEEWGDFVEEADQKLNQSFSFDTPFTYLIKYKKI